MISRPRAIFGIAAITFLLSTILFAQRPDEEEELTVDSSIVLLNVIVKDKASHYVSGLNKPQFRVFENGIEQNIEYFSAEETPFAAVILLDTSGSMEERVSLARAAAGVFLDGLRENDVACVYTFDSKVTLLRQFSNSRDLPEKIYDVKADGMTRLNDAVFEAADILSKRPEKRRAIIILSDGQDTSSKRSSDKAIKAAVDAEAVVYTIDMSPMNDSKRIQNQVPLKMFAEKSGGTFVATPGGAALRDAFQNIVEELGNQYTVGYSPKDDGKTGGWRAIELKIARPGLFIRTREGYQASKK